MPSSDVRQEYARLARRYDRRWSRYVRRSVRQTLRRIALPPHARVLDVGCGTGALALELARTRSDVTVAGIDVCPEMLVVARGKLHEDAWLAAGCAERLPFGDAMFDAVVSTSSFHFWAEPQRGLAEVRRVLVPRGRLVLTDWCHDYLTCRACDVLLRLLRRAQHRSYRAVECRRMLQEAGFAVEGVNRYRVTWFWGLMTACASGPAARTAHATLDSRALPAVPQSAASYAAHGNDRIDR